MLLNDVYNCFNHFFSGTHMYHLTLTIKEKVFLHFFCAYILSIVSKNNDKLNVLILRINKNLIFDRKKKYIQYSFMIVYKITSIVFKQNVCLHPLHMKFGRF